MGSGDKSVISLWAFTFDEKASANGATTSIESDDFNVRSSSAKTTAGDRTHRSSKPRQGAVNALDEAEAAALLHVLANPVIDELDDHIAVLVEEHFVHVAVDAGVFEAHKLVLHARLIEPLGNADVEHAVIRALGGDG